MEIIKGDFIYKGETRRGLYTPGGGTLIAGWGRPISSHVTGVNINPYSIVLKFPIFHTVNIYLLEM